jgi:N-acetylneuraminate epimerase
MKTPRLLILPILLLACACLGATNSLPTPHWSQLPPLPNQLGVAGPFAGVSGTALLVAGGANFPDRMPWQGGTKVWHDEIYLLSATNADWRLVGKLPRPLAYGVSATIPGGVLCIGGGDGKTHRPDVFALSWNGRQLTTRLRQALPIPLATAAGAVVGDKIYIACGAAAPGEQAALKRVFTLDYQQPTARWCELEPLPGKPRILPLAASLDGVFYLAGGAALEPGSNGVSRVYLKDTWCYRVGRGWRRLADLPSPRVAAPTPAPTANASFFVFGGDAGSLVNFQPLDQHPGFPKALFAYDVKLNAWQNLGDAPFARAVLPTVFWRGQFVLPSGEVRPGVRSPEVWALRLQ